jgi:hypothetical protein
MALIHARILLRSRAGRSEAFGTDTIGRESETDERIGRCLDQGGRSTDVRAGADTKGFDHLSQHALVDPARISRPALRL